MFSPKNFDFGRKSVKKRVVVKQKNETAKGFAVFFKVRGNVTCLHSAHKLL